MRTLSGARADRPCLRRHLRRVQAPASGPRVDSPILDPTGARQFVADVRERALQRARRVVARRRRSAPRAAASSTAWSCSTSTSTTRRCSPPSSSWTTSRTPTPTAMPTPNPRSSTTTSRRSRRRRADPGRHVRDRHERRSVGLRQRTTGARGHASLRTASTPRRSPTARTASSSKPVGTTTARLWDAGGLGVASGSRRSLHRSSGTARAAARGRVDASAAPRTSRSTSRCSTCAGTRRMRTPAGRRAAALRDRVGDRGGRARRPTHANLWRAGPAPLRALRRARAPTPAR